MSGPGSPISPGGASARLAGMEAAPDEEGTGPDIMGASALSYGCSHGKWNMANGIWQMTDDRGAEDLKARAICSLSFAICHLPFAMPDPRNHVSPPVPCRPAPASRSAPVQGP